jgi:hypothetical protein
MALTALVKAISISGGYTQTHKANFVPGGSKIRIQNALALITFFYIGCRRIRLHYQDRQKR